MEKPAKGPSRNELAGISGKRGKKGAGKRLVSEMKAKKQRGTESGCAPKSVQQATQEAGAKPSDHHTDTDKCPSCSGILKPCLDRVGQPPLYTQCSLMPESHQFCRSCLAPWKPIHEDGIERCSNRSCEVVSVLITCDKVTDPKSKVLGCPVFRACPKCYSLIMHMNGCKYVFCRKCRHYFCFICLRSGHSCGKAMELYSSLTCKKPQAGRQTFIT